MQLLLGQAAYVRNYGNFPPIEIINRFVESDPAQPSSPYTLLARPGTSLLAVVGSNPARGRFTHPGLFGGDLFVVEGENIWRLSADDDWNISTQPIAGVVQDNGSPSFALMKGDGYEYLFIADGRSLQYYEGESRAKATLTATSVSDGDKIQIDAVYYQWTSGSVDAGSPSGSLADPWLVDVGANTYEALDNLHLAVNGTGIGGTTYSSGLTAHTSFEVWQHLTSPERLIIRAKEAGSAYNGKDVTVETGAGLSWNNSTTTGGGVHALSAVSMPDDSAAGKCASLNGHVLVTVANTNRFYWIFPSETAIDPLNTATAEAQPGAILDLLTVGDQAWFVKQSSVEPFYGEATDEGATFVPVGGAQFSRGGVEGTAMVVDDVVFLLGNDGIVYSVGGSIDRVSDHALEGIIRSARAAGGF